MLMAQLRHRETDDYGSGEFGVSRAGGKRQHNGVDYQCDPYTMILSPISGTVSKLGYPYADDLSYRYVEVTDTLQRKHRLFYVDPYVTVGYKVTVGEIVGMAQDISKRYTSNGHMNNHVHYEIKVGSTFINPESI